MVKFDNEWDIILKDEFQKEYYKKIHNFLVEEYKNPAYPIYPNMYDIFNALKITDYNGVKAVILGQDPYHGPNQAHGLAFSVKEGVQPPPSLVNIYKEYHILNTVLTVRGGQAASHRGIGWEIFTDRIIELLNQREKPVVFLLWGRFARDKKALITNPNHHILEAAHPSPLSAYNGFFGCRHFSKTNLLIPDDPVDWRLD